MNMFNRRTLNYESVPDCESFLIEGAEEDYQCKHSNIFDDESTADSICTDCGLVLNRLMNSNATNTNTDSNKGLSYFDSIIYDICANHNIPYNIATYAISLKKWLQYELKENRNSKRVLASYCIYEAGHRLRNPRPIREIAYFGGVPIKALWKIRCKLRNPTTCSNTNTFAHETLESYCNLFNIPYCDYMKIMTVLDEIEVLESVKPQTAISVLIFLYCKQNANTSSVSLSLNDVSERCGISVSNMKKTLKKLPINITKNIFSVL